MKTMKNKKINNLMLNMVLLLPLALQAQYGIEITSAGSITAIGASSIIINDGGFINNGSYTKGSETVSFLGNTAKTISGSSNTGLYNLTINNTAGITTQIGLLTANNVTIATGSKFTIDAAKAVTVTGSLTNSAGTAGLVIKSSADGTGSLIENTTGVSATVERYIPSNSSYYYVSSAVTNALSEVFHYAWLYDWVEPSQSWHNITSTTTSITPTKGYSLRLSNVSGNPSISPNNPVIFTGELNTGSQGSSNNIEYNPAGTIVNQRGFNLVGNPYPSGIDWDAATGWTKTNVNDAIYFWDGINSRYSSYISGTGNNGGTRYIAAHQGFMVRSNGTTGTLQMTNDVRTHSESGAFRSALANVLRFNITTDNLMSDYENMSDETVIRFIDGATSNFDGNFDAYKLFGLKEYPQLYTLTADGKPLSINAFGDAINDTIKVKMNLRIGLRSYYKITATGMESFDNNTYIAIEDTKLNTTQVLTENPIYSFYGDTSYNDERFIVWFFPKPINNTNVAGNIAQDDINIYSNRKNIFIDLNGINSAGAEMTILNMLGQRVDEKKITSINKSSYETNLPTGLYIVRIATTDGKTFEKKLYIEN